MRKRLIKITFWSLFAISLLIVSGLLLADYLTPPATGETEHALAVQDDQTEIDKELAPLLARNPGKTGAILLVDGLDAFAARAQSARQAGRSLDVQYYIWKDDITGHLLLNELWLAANRGVRVRLLLDDINTGGKDNALLAMAQHPNIAVRVYNPFRNRSGIWRLVEMVQRIWSINHRMHNKAWIADGWVTVVGGRNVGKEYFDAADGTNFRDLDLLLFGPAVEQASAIFDDFWNSDAVVPITALNNKEAKQLQAVMAEIQIEAQSPEARQYIERVHGSDHVLRYFAQQLTPHWSDSIQILSDPPTKRAGDDRTQWLYRHIMHDLAAAKSQASIISPYFVPDHDSMQGMFDALANKDVDVSIVTNSMVANDVIAVHSGYQQYRLPLLEHGFKLFEIRARPNSESSLFGSSGASLHTKAYLVDGHIGFIGSFNMDSRSINLNTEMGVAFDHAGMTADLQQEYEKLISPAFSYQVSLSEAGTLQWLDQRGDDTLVLTQEPDSTFWQRLLVSMLALLPIESQL